MTRPQAQATYDPDANFDVEEIDTTYRRDNKREWRLRVYQPHGPGPFPVLLSAHGGAWNSDSYLVNAEIERALARSGIVVASIELRRAPEFKYPASVADVDYAVRWLKAHAQQYRGNPNQIGTLGISSGGHLVVLARCARDRRYASLPLPEALGTDATPRFVIAAWPVIDPWARFELAKERNNQSLMTSHYNYFVTDEAMKEGNPQTIIDSGQRPAVLPPLLIVHGDADTVVPPSHPERFVASYRAAGGEAELELFKNMPHGFMRENPGPESDRTLAVMKTFIACQVGARATAGA